MRRTILLVTFSLLFSACGDMTIDLDAQNRDLQDGTQEFIEQSQEDGGVEESQSSEEESGGSGIGGSGDGDKNEEITG